MDSNSADFWHSYYVNSPDVINKTTDVLIPIVILCPELTNANLRLNQRLTVTTLSDNDPYASTIRNSPFGTKPFITPVMISLADKFQR